MRVRTLMILVALGASACGGGREVQPGTQGPRPSAGDGGRTDARVDGGLAEDDAAAGADAMVFDATGAPDSGARDSGGGGFDAAVVRPPSGAYLYVGAGGGGPGSDLSVGAVADAIRAARLPAEIGEAPPADLVSRYGLLALMNPRSGVPADVVRLAQQLLVGGGRVLLVMEHCKNGCYGDVPGNNALLAALGSQLVVSGSGGAPLSRTALDLTPVPGITDGVGSLVAYYSGSVTAVGSGVALGRVPGGDVVIGYQRVGAGELLVVTDSSMFGYVLAEGDNRRFVANLATF